MSVAALIILAGLQTAANENPKGPCPGLNTRQVEACLDREQGALDAELARYTAKAGEQMTSGPRGKDVLKSFRAGETAWRSYVRAECDALYDHWSQGTIRGSMARGCVQALTADRTYRIWTNWLVIPGGEPILPDPRPRRVAP